VLGTHPKVADWERKWVAAIIRWDAVTSQFWVPISFGPRVDDAGPLDSDAGQDYEATNGTLTFEPGETTQTIEVTVNGDSDPETGGEDFFMDLSNATNATLLDAQGLGFIEDDD
jgi:Calx-beta domain